MFSKKTAIYSVCVILMVDYLGYGMLIPIMPQLFLNHKLGLLGANVSLVNRELLYGVVLSVFSFVNIIGAPFVCSLADRFGRKKVLLIGACILVVNYLFGAVSIMLHSIWLFVLNRMFAGILDGVYPIIEAVAGDLGETKKDVVYNFRVISFSTTLATILSPTLSFFIHGINFPEPLAVPFILASIISAFGVSFVVYSLKNITLVGAVNRGDLSWFQGINLVSGLRHMFGKIHMRFVTMSYVVFQFGTGLLVQGVSLYLTVDYSYSLTKISIFMSVMYSVMLLSLYLLPKILTRFFDYKKQILFSLAVLSLVLVFEFLVKEFDVRIIFERRIGIWIAFGLFFFIRPLIDVIFNSLLASSVSDQKRAMIMGGSSQVFAISWGISALLVGVLLRHKMILWVSAIALIISFILLVIHFRIISRSKNSHSV